MARTQHVSYLVGAMNNLLRISCLRPLPTAM